MMKNARFANILPYLMPFIPILGGIYLLENVWAAMLGYHLLAVTFLIVNKQGRHFKRLLVGGTPGTILIFSLLAALSGVLLFFVSRYMSIPVDFGLILERMGLTSENWLLFILYYAFVNPIIEEVYWRGFLGTETKNISLSDIAYAGYHPLVFLRFVSWPWALIEFGLLFVVAWLWRRLIRIYGGLLLPVLMHLFADLSIGIAIYYLARSMR